MGFTFGVTGPSGMDLNTMVDALVSIEESKVTRVQDQKSVDKVKIDAYSKIRSLLFDIKTKADALSQTTAFDIFKATSSNAEAVTISGSSGGSNGNYAINVFQTATAEKMISADKKITSLTATLASQGITVGDISIGGIKISITASDTLNDLRSKINSAADSKGNRLGATASVVKISDVDYRLIVSAKESGAAGLEYKDLTGSTLQDLGFITSADGDKGTINQSLRSTDDIVSAFNALSVGQAIFYEGTDHDGNAVSNTFIKTAGSTIDDFLAQLKAAYHNAVELTTDGGGLLGVTDSVAGVSKLTLSKLTIGATNHAVSLNAVGTEGKGVLSAGKDAYFSIEGMLMKTTTNSVSDFIPGTTVTLKSASAGKTVTVGLSRDLDAVTANFKALIDSYNKLAEYAETAMKLADPKDKTSQAGELAGDMTLLTIVNKVRDAFRNNFSLAGGKLSSMTMVGLKSDPQTGSLSVDENKFKKALETDLESVLKLFTTTSSSDNPAVVLGRNTAATQTGRYVLEEIDSMHIRIRKENSTEWYTSDARHGDVVMFSKGPAQGLALSSPAGAISGSSTFTLSKGLSTVLSETLAQMTDSMTGVVAIRQKALQATVQRADERIADLTDRVTSYRNRLIRQFSDMQTNLSQLQQQGSSINRAFGSQASTY
jgi:flagellar hook-associated protein 2